MSGSEEQADLADGGKGPEGRGRKLTLLILPDGGGAGRSFELSYRAVRRWVWGGALLVVVMVGMASSWFYMAVRSRRVSGLEAEVAQLRDGMSSASELADRLHDLEAQYLRIRDLFGAGTVSDLPELWLPPPTGRSAASPRESQTEGRPTGWPLTEAGFITRTFNGDTANVEDFHPGLDIAVATGSYIRAAGPGRVMDVGTDPVYGFYVRLDHGDGYETMYGHAATTLVAVNDEVRRGQVIALSGSTGQSSAPHLHFEVILDGGWLDPQTLLDEP